ncbi:hypothetical protein BBJ28_00016124 [Nothophytophthora sp. Chile5]|nr:hypothetical protein BBJ28_00016124 [Nothophytophthora sp. Chile5]
MRGLILFPMSLQLLLLLGAVGILVVAAGDERQVRTVLNARPSRWQRDSRVAPELMLALRVALQPGKSDQELADVVAAVTDPASASYGQHLTTSEQLREHFAPPELHSLRLQQFLQSVDGVSAAPTDAVGDFWRVKLSAIVAETLFDTKLYHYRHRQRSGLVLVRPEETYRLPVEIQDVVAYVDGLESFPTEMQARFMQHNRKEGHDPLANKMQPTSDAFRVASDATPAVIRTQYDIPKDLSVVHSNVSIQQNAAESGDDAVDRNKLVLGTFLHEFYSESDLRQFLRAIDGQTEQLKMPTTRGPCLVSRSATGEASLDVQVTAALAGREGTSLEMMCYAQLRDSTRGYAADNQEPFLTFLQDVNALQPPPAVVSISYTDDECSVPPGYAAAVNRELMKTALRGISVLVSAGDAGVRGSHLAEGFCGVRHCSKFLAMFPASSPFVTAVGATTIATGAKQDEQSKWPEAVTSTAQAGALITSGGGFSEVYDMPSYQKSAVESYLTFANASGLAPFFRASGRAFPDVAAVGHAFPVVVNGALSSTDGTSVSAPVVASMIALLNGALPDLPPLGFLNPLLYRLSTVCPQVFTDITQGETSCGSKGMQCCPRGHEATTGWDAASGLGTLRFATLLRDLPACLKQIRAKEQAEWAHNLSDLETQTQKSGTRNTWTTGERQATRFLGSVAMVAAVALIGVLIALRERLFLAPGERQGGSTRYVTCSAHDSAREYLLARDSVAN